MSRTITVAAPQTSYGMHKLVCEHLVADYTRKGYIDGRAARLRIERSSRRRFRLAVRRARAKHLGSTPVPSR